MQTVRISNTRRNGLAESPYTPQLPGRAPCPAWSDLADWLAAAARSSAFTDSNPITGPMPSLRQP